MNPIQRRARRAPRLALVSLLASAGGLGGCVSQQAYDDVVHENRTLKSRLVELQGENGDLESTVGSLRSRLNAVPRSSGDDEANALLRQQLNQSRETIADLERRLDNMDFAPLDPVTDDALRRLAGQYPDLILYDAERGMLRFASDLTFDTASAVVKPQARNSLTALSNILKSNAAAGYDVRVVGHTDAQPISAKTRERFPSNMHLSTFRAIAVRDELLKLGIPADRVMAAGWGEHRPLVPNGPDGVTPANRRVEVYLIPGHGTSSTGFAPAGRDAVIDRDSLGGSSYEPTK